LQDYLREAGCLIRLGHLVAHADRSVQMAALLAVANMALNTENQKEMGVGTSAWLEGVTSQNECGGV